MQPDNELLQQYVRSHSEDAFAELVRRHVNLVYSAALRQVAGDAHIARDVAQNVFTDLARKAASLSRRESLTGWLYTSAYFAANKIVRTEIRRRQREEQFMREPTRHTTPDANWEQLRPALDSVMHELNETDREAVLLRYFENRAYAEVGAKLNLNENAARMRVDRALEKLRTLLAKRGITTGAALAAVISANAIQTAPGTLAPTLASASLTGASTGGFFQMMNALKFKIGAGALVVAGAAIVFTASRNTHATPQTQNTQSADQMPRTKTAENISPNSPQPDDTVAGNPSIPATNPSAQPALAHTNDLTASTELQTTNTAPETNKTVVKLRVKIVTLSADNLQALRPAWPGGDSGTLTEDQLKFVTKAIENTGVFSATDSEITTFNAHQVLMAAKTPPLIGDTNASVDAMFGVTPYFSPESSVFRLNLFLALYTPKGDSFTPDTQTIGKTNEITLSVSQVAVLQKEIPSELLPSGSGAKEILAFVRPEAVQTSLDTFKEQTYFGYRERSTAKVCAAEMIMYAKGHNDQFPVNLDQLGDGNPEIRRFEISYQGFASNILNPASTIILREIQPWQNNGAWARTYGFADGHTEIHTEANNDFTAFEREHAVAPAN